VELLGAACDERLLKTLHNTEFAVRLEERAGLYEAPYETELRVRYTVALAIARAWQGDYVEAVAVLLRQADNSDIIRALVEADTYQTQPNLGTWISGALQFARTPRSTSGIELQQLWKDFSAHIAMRVPEEERNGRTAINFVMGIPLSKPSAPVSVLQTTS